MCSLLGRVGPPLAAIFAGVAASKELQENYAAVASQLEQALHALPEDERASALNTALKILPVAVPVMVFLVVYIVLSAASSLLSGVLSCVFCADGGASQDTPYVRVVPPPTFAVGFADGLCSCLNDVPICVTACCLPFITVGQLAQRVLLWRACPLIAWSIGGLSVAGIVVSSCWCAAVECSVSDEGVRCETHDEDLDSPICWVATRLNSACYLASAALVTMVRKRVRSMHAIAPTCCGEGCDDCCTAFCCLPLAAAQIMRHENECLRQTWPAVKYSICSPDGIARGAAPPPPGPPEYGPAGGEVPMGLPVA